MVWRKKNVELFTWRENLYLWFRTNGDFKGKIHGSFPVDGPFCCWYGNVQYWVLPKFQSGASTVLSAGTSRDRISLWAHLAFNITAPHKLTLALDNLIIFLCLMPHFARVAQRFTFGRGHFVASACSSQHSWGPYTVVPHAIIWGRVEIDQLSFSFGSSSCLLVDSFL